VKKAHSYLLQVKVPVQNDSIYSGIQQA